MKKMVILSLVPTFLLWGCSTLNQSPKVSSAEDIMEYVKVCNRQNECKKFSRLIMGTDHLLHANWTKDGQKKMTDAQLYEVLNEAVKLGINIFDTSPIYVGNIENKLGKWLRSSKKKILEDKFYSNKALNPDRNLYTISKGGFPFDLYYFKKLKPGTHSGQLKQILSGHGILNSNSKRLKDGSLKLKNVPPGTYAARLYGSEKQIKKRISEELNDTFFNLIGDITIYLMHRDDGDFFKFNEVVRKKTPVKTILKALSADQITSKYWSLGLSNWKTHRVNESIKLSDKYPNLPRPSLNSPYFSLFEMSNRTIHAGGVQVTHEEMKDPHFQKGIKLMPYSPLGGFSILDKPEPRWENGKKAAKKKYDQGNAYWRNVFHSIFTDANEARYKRVVEFTNRFNKLNNTNYTLDQMINAYALAHKRTDFLTVGPITVAQLRRTYGSLKLARMLTEKDLDYLYGGE